MNSNFPPQVVLFDFDGTLIDSEKPTIDLAEPIISGYLGRKLTDSDIRLLRGKVWVNVFREWFPGKEQKAYNEIVECWKDADPSIDMYDGVREMISGLKENGYRIGIVSSRETDLIEEIVEEFSMAHFFEVIVGQDKTARHKPHPEPLHHGSGKLGICSSECIYIGDQPGDVIASREAGMFSGAALWGQADPEEMKYSLPDFFFHSPPGVLKLLIR